MSQILLIFWIQFISSILYYWNMERQVTLTYVASSEPFGNPKVFLGIPNVLLKYMSIFQSITSHLLLITSHHCSTPTPANSPNATINALGEQGGERSSPLCWAQLGKPKWEKLYPFFFFFCGTGVWTPGFPAYHFSHTSSPLFSDYFGDGVLRITCPDWPQISILLILPSQ
jgi:hypothetical protein